MARFNSDLTSLQRSKFVSKKPVIEQLEDRYVLDAWSLSLDFGKPSSPVDSAFKKFGTALQGREAYGWAKPGLVAYDSASGPALTRDGVKGRDNSFLVNLPNGTYQVTATLGDPLSSIDKVSLFANGVRVLNKLTNYQDRIVTISFKATITTGKLRLTFQDEGGINPYFSLSALEVKQVVPDQVKPLQASITSSLTVNEGSALGFTGSVTGGKAPYSYQWSFGDGNQTSGTLTPTHTYADNGQYQVTLTVTDSASKSTTTKVTVNVKNVAPKVSISGATRTSSGTVVNYRSTVTDAGASDTQAGFTYLWNFGDGSTSTESNPSHAFARSGTYAVKLTVKDKDGLTATASMTTSVTAVQTFAVSIQPGATTVQEGQNAEFSAVLNGGNAPFSYSWNFGDSSPVATGSTVNHVFADNGQYVVQLSVKDATNVTKTASVTVNVTNVAPTLSINGATDATTGSSVNYQATVNDTGSEDMKAGFSYLWDFGDGTISTLSNPRHTFNNAGQYQVRLTVKDKDGASSTASMTTRVTATQSFSVAIQPSSTNINEGSQATLNAVVTGGTAPFTYSWNFGDGSPLGTTSSVNHTFADNGQYSVQLSVTDSANITKTASVTVAVNNVAPTGQITGAAQAPVGANIPYSSRVTDPGTADQQAGFVYRWEFGDGSTSTQANPSHSFTSAGNYNIKLTVTDKDGGSSTSQYATTISGTTTSTLFVTSDFIQSPYLKMPNFGGHPTIVTAQSGNWSDPATWGGRLPQEGDIVAIAAGHTVTFDVVSNTIFDVVAVQDNGKLIFKTDVNTKLRVSTLLIMERGELTVGTTANPVLSSVSAQILFPDIPNDTSFDPEQFGHGLIAFGKVTMHGNERSDTFIRLAQAPLLGATTIQLSSPATGWKVGDKLALPDTHQLDWWEQHLLYQNYVPQWETPSITGISADGKTITLSAPLQYNHAGNAEFLPHVAVLTRNVLVKSENSLGNRGYAMFTHRADVDIRYAQFAGLGRTTKDAFDNTTYDASGLVNHIGTNQQNRYPVSFFHVMGLVDDPDQYQYRFEGNSVVCMMNPFIFRWGLAINDSHFGLINNNVIYNWAGSGVSVENGNETGNVFSDNYVSRIFGTGERVNDGLDGLGYWFRGTNNSIYDNVATNIRGAGPYCYGFNISPYYVGQVAIPAFPGADLSLQGQTTQMDMNAISLPEFARNEVYGATYNGLTLWWIGTFVQDPRGTAGVVKDFRVWNVNGWGYFGYETNGLTIDGWTQRGDTSLDRDNWAQLGLQFGDYYQKNLEIRNADIRGVQVGIAAPSFADGTWIVRDSYLKNIANIVIGTMWSVHGGSILKPRTTIIDNVKFDRYEGNRYFATPQDIMMKFSAVGGTNVIQSDSVYVYNYNQISGDNFRVYYKEQAANFVVPMTGSNIPNEPGARPVIGSPEAGLTNQQNWIKYGLAIAGAVSPTNLLRPHIFGFVDPIL